ncbi:MAG: Z1 domain-containing protein [Hormoscilla sp. GM7CHS1pb]|nr:Z1 domain-containing protein [Hormoscilla sp. GM7CHS1pb]
MSDYKTALQMALNFLNRKLKGEQRPPTREDIRNVVSKVLRILREDELAAEVNEETLVRHIETMYNVCIGQGTVLDNKEDHIPWLPDRKSEISWNFWERYSRYIEDEKGWAPATIRGLDKLTDQILERLEDPQRKGAWDRRGMVVGQVQSGKTSNYIGLICKAVDAGYKLIIVLAGMQKSLRSQTQLRLDEGFLGFDSQVHRAKAQGSSLIGAGEIIVGKRLIANSATSSADKGDFNTRVASQFGVSPGGGSPLLFVVKKNKSVLNNLLQWALHQGDRDEESGKYTVRKVPLLVIDDEADNASINTNPTVFDEKGNVEDELDVSAINGLIRKLLHSFEQSAYVGYTATPFANIFIYPDPDKKNPEYGDDLFPRSFIINMPAPSNYVGPAKVFGLDAEPAVDLEEIKGLPIIRSVEDYKDWMPNAHKKDHIPGELPKSLREAVISFVLSCAVRIVRGQENAHNSMLVHVTRFTDVQAQVAKQIENELYFLQRALRDSNGKASSQVLDEFEQLWKNDFLPTIQSVTESIDDPELQLVSWEKVKPLLYRAASKIKVKKINGTAKDILDYRENKNGLNVIAIGGDKLSRGLTLEGLTVSYYLRASKMYDTLMQMGRWFGYKPGYIDLCRLYTTDDIVKWYEHITVASEELRQEFDYMAGIGETPADFGLKVRTHPQGLMITGVNKMKTGINMLMSYARSLSQTTIFYKDDKINRENLKLTENMLLDLREISKEENGNYIWEKIPAARIIDFLHGYKVHPDCRPANTLLLMNYINSRLKDDELVSWTVVLISKKGSQNKTSIAKLKVGLADRGERKYKSPEKVGLADRREREPKSPEVYQVKYNLLSPEDEWIDLPKKTRLLIMEKTNEERKSKGKEPSKTPNSSILRSQRSPRNGLLLLYPLNPEIVDGIDPTIPVMGFVISFPNSRTDQLIEYRVNNVYWEQEFGNP